jgi:mannose-1-phosphate guanylyltransferase
MKSMMEHVYALVLAGGSGTRLWPHSRSQRPKQFLSLNGGHTMLQETVARTASLIPPERVYVATNAAYVPLVAEQLPDVPADQILAEPSGRGTAPCIGLAALHLLRRDPEAVMVILSADHRILHADRLCQALEAAAEVAAAGKLVTLGIMPTAPATGYGYIQRGESITTSGVQSVYTVQSFAEKPDLDRARSYLASGEYYWNAGMFVWRADTILNELATYRPLLSHGLKLIGDSINSDTYDATLATTWGELENVAIDVAVMERTTQATVIPVDLGWSDVGDWAALADVLPTDSKGNVVVGTHVSVDTHNTLIFGNGRVVATIGLDDLLIIDTEDALLICPRDRAQDVKHIVNQIKKQHQHLA